MILRLLNDENHGFQDKKLFLRKSLKVSEINVTPILEMFFGPARTVEEKRAFIQDSLFKPEVIIFLGNLPQIMLQVDLAQETQKLIEGRFNFLKRLENGNYIFNVIKNENDPNLQVLGYMYVFNGPLQEQMQRLIFHETAA